MKMKISLALIGATLLAGACSQSEIEGHVYIIKGGGDVKPSAGETVRLIPLKDRPDLFYPASMAAFKTVTGGLGDQLDPSCRSAGEFIAHTRNGLETERDYIQPRDNIPDSGCSDLEAEAERLASEAEEMEKAHSERVTALENELRETRNRRSQKVISRSQQLKNKALERITIGSLRSASYGRGRYTGTIHNSSDYCVGGTIEVELYSKGVKIGDGREYGNQKDQFGFAVPCLVLPQASRDAFASAPDASSPESRLLISQHDLPTAGPSILSHIRPDEMTLIKNGIEFFNLVSKQEGSKIEYTRTPVNWSELAVAGMTLEEDTQIASIANRLSRINEAHDAHALTKSHADARSAVQSCAADESAMQLLTDRLSALNEAESELAACTEDDADASRAISALISLNADFDQRFEVPEIEEEYLAAAVGNVLSAILDDSVKRTEATIEGGYEFQGINRGNYLLYSEYADSFVQGFWLKPIIFEGSSRFDLNHKSFVGVSLFDYITSQFRASCMGCTREEFENSMASEADIVAAHGD